MAGLGSSATAAACEAPGGTVGGPCARAGKAEAIIAVIITAIVRIKGMRFTAKFTSFHATFTTRTHLRRKMSRAEHSEGRFSESQFPSADRIPSILLFTGVRGSGILRTSP